MVGFFMPSTYYQKMVYIPESFIHRLEQFEKVIKKDPMYSEARLKGKGSFSKFVRVCMLKYLWQKKKESELKKSEEE